MARVLIELGRVSKCARNQIRRAGYVRKDGVRVKSACVPDKGAKGKTSASRKWLPDLGSAPIGRWTKKKSAPARLEALKTKAKSSGCKLTLQNLNALRNVTTDAETKRKMTADWIRLSRACESGRVR